MNVHRDAKLTQASGLSFFIAVCYNYMYRMKALDAIRDSGKQTNVKLAGLVAVSIWKHMATVPARIHTLSVPPYTP